MLTPGKGDWVHSASTKCLRWAGMSRRMDSETVLPGLVLEEGLRARPPQTEQSDEGSSKGPWQKADALSMAAGTALLNVPP